MATLGVTDRKYSSVGTVTLCGIDVCLTLIVYVPKVNPFPPVCKCDAMVPLRDVVSDSSLQGDVLFRSCGHFF